MSAHHVNHHQHHNQESLDVLIQRITNPLSQNYDPSLVYTFCERMKQQQDGPVAATRLLAYRVQSPDEKEAMLALDLLDTCARTGGASFQAELGKFRFLNELIKLLSPRYLGSRTPHRVKQRVADLLLSWAHQIPHESKIQEAYSLVEKQGLLAMHGITPRSTSGAAQRPAGQLSAPAVDAPAQDAALDPHRPPTPPLPSRDRPENPIFEDGQKAALLKRLLQSTNPEDIQAANRLIKTMVKQDEERVERVSRRVTELETVRTNLRLLEEMMDSYSPGTTSQDELDLMTELRTSCSQMRSKLDSLAAETGDQDPALAELVAASEEVGRVLDRHDRLLSDGAPPLTLLQLGSPQRPPPPPPSGQLMLDQQLARLGLADVEPTPPAAPSGGPDLLSSLSPPSGPAGPAGPGAGGGGGLADLLGALDPPTAAAAAAPAVISPRTPQRAAPAPTPAVCPQARSALDELDDLVRLSMTGSVPAANRNQCTKTPPIPSSPGSTPRRASTNDNSGPPSSLLGPMNEAASLLPANQSASSSSEHSLLDVGGGPGAEPNGRRPMGDAAPDDVSLLSALGGPSSLDVPLSGPGSDEGPARAAGEPAASARPPLSLADVAVPLQDIKPGGRPPVPLFSEPQSLEITLHPAENRPRPDVTVYVITALNRTGRAVSQYTLQAVCDKGARVRLQAPSSTELAAGSPFLPPPAASQVMLLANPQQMAVTFRFMLSYCVDGDTITEMAVVPDPGRS